MAIARFYRKYTSRQTIDFDAADSRWQYVVIRDTSGSNTWTALRFNADGSGSVDVDRDISYELAFATDNTTATWVELQRTGQPPYAGTDISVGQEDPPPPPPSRPTESFAASAMIRRASAARMARPDFAARGADDGAPLLASTEEVVIARKYRRFRTDQTVSFSAGAGWTHVVVRDTSSNRTWGGLRFTTDGRGTVNVRRGVSYELAFTKVDFDRAVARGLNDAGQAEYDGSDIVVGQEDPPPPPPDRPTRAFERTEVVARGGEHARVWPEEDQPRVVVRTGSFATRTVADDVLVAQLPAFAEAATATNGKS
jgi:hypothetical protein